MTSTQGTPRTAIALTAVWLLLGGGLVAAGGQEQGPDQRPVFRSSGDLVQVDFSVLDKRRVPVGDLTQDEVVVLEDGKARPIVAFTRVDAGAPGATPAASAPAAAAPGPAPGDATAGPDAAPPSSTDQAAAAPSAEHGRLVTILFDRSIPAGPATVTARQAALGVVESLGPDDVAAVVRGGGFSSEGLSQAFTRDHAAVRRAILSPFMGQIAAPEMRQVTETDPGGLEDGRPDQMFTGDCTCGLCSLRAIAGVARTVRDVPGRRKVLVWIGSDLVVETPDIECSFRVRGERQRLFRELDLSNLTVHTIDPTGLETRVLPAASTMRANRAGMRQNENRVDAQDRGGNLSVLPDRTGGRSIQNSNTPWEQVPALLGESRVFYLLAFAPAKPAPDGRFHKIEVKVRRKGLTVQGRRGYLAAEPGR